MRNVGPFVVAGACILVIHCRHQDGKGVPAHDTGPELAGPPDSGVSSESGEPFDTGPKAGVAEPETVLQGLAQDVALVHFVSFETLSGAMAEKASVLCDTLTEAALADARDAWWAARTPWKRAEIIQFGPVTEYPLRLGPKLDDWPVNEDAVEELVLGDLGLDQSGFDSMGTATRGLPVVEYLLWGSGDETLEGLAVDARRCAVLVGAASDVHANAERLVESWRDEWVVQLTVPEDVAEGAYETKQEVIDEWVNRMAFTVENVRLTKLGKPVGDAANGNPQPDTIESRYSGRSLTDAQDALAGALDVWTGSSDTESPGIRDMVSDPVVVDTLDRYFSTAAERLAEVPETLEDTIWSQPELVARAQEPLLLLQAAIQVELADHLGVTITFNDADGD